MRTIHTTHKAAYEPIGDLITYRAMPTKTFAMNRLDPFIFLNHHGWQTYPPHNNGLPFGPHPHRGFETVTFILEGDLTHKDSYSGESTIKAGGIQWMTAGSGLVHAEVSSDEFKQKGGPLEILQLWINLPARYKMVAPKYIGLQKDELPVLQIAPGITADIIAGNWQGTEGAVQPLTDIHLAKIDFKQYGHAYFNVPTDNNILLYIVKGQIKVNQVPVPYRHLVEFKHDAANIVMEPDNEAVVLFGYARPLNEPFVASGPFVMNTKEEIVQAIDDYNKGKFGLMEV
jgi:redox-sensitive bicupin YhaK (pirin superfamily)